MTVFSPEKFSFNRLIRILQNVSQNTSSPAYSGKSVTKKSVCEQSLVRIIIKSKNIKQIPS
jgi:hypothetical protein